MKFLRIGQPGRETPVLQHDGTHFDLSPLTADIDGAFLSGEGVAATRTALQQGELKPLDVDGHRVAPPIAQPGKIVCIGLNYRDHAAETGATLPTEPVVFMKDPSTIVGPYDDVLVPRGSTKTDWEVELGVVIGKTARYLESSATASAYIAGFVLSHDVSEREFQLERGGQWDKGKSCETFNPLGPWLSTPDEITDVQNLALTLSVNGVGRQRGTTADMLFAVDHVVWYLSQFMVLRPGDLINTGTPAGVALGLPGTPYLRADDVVELSIDGLGTARQRFVDA
ncbi:fumarylacetoacetate hydrolase family protein [Microbacterium hatanonis]|uniref:Fumarylacetoacetate hydrolase family protein n=1 Tax=Microbacterium hatanonis TaxID=404366 RepID=A0A5C8HUE9_9MICO|nr:fumarylacetoacetate hydrolase family protein [Microbacterium hatanonis]TXK09723.1 fumarylacetoacetate hydrolase family protein [Microbacterium hatanonis]